MFNNDQISSLVRTLFKMLGAALMVHGYATAAGFLNDQTITGLVVAFIAALLSHWSNSTSTSGAASQSSKLPPVVLVLLLGSLLFTGCASTLNTPGGKIVSITERFIGFQVEATSSTTQTPKVIFGFGTSAVILEPTSTNGPIYAPNFANTFDFAQAGALDLGIGEKIASGNYQLLQPNATNSANAIVPVVPK